MASEVLALIPARAGSKGVPGKNFAALAGVSPLERAARCCVSAGLRVVISTDGAIPNDYVVSARFLARPAAFATDSSPMIDVVKHALGEIPGPPDQIILLVQPTQPLRQPKHLRAAIELLGPQYSSVVSVVEVPKAESPELLCWIGDLSGYLCPFDAKRGLLGGEPRDWSIRPTRRQATGKWYRPDGTVYAARREAILKFNSLFGPCVKPLIIPPEETCALDTPSDWREAERRLRALSELPLP